jgi:putative phage-type endonuclease
MLSNIQTLPSRDAWQANRKTYLGGSDAAAILGACPYRSAIEVYADKLGLLDAKPTSEAMRWGQILEPVIATEVADRIGRPVQLWDQATIVRNPTHNWQACTPDAIIDDGEQIVQIKTTSNREAAEEPPLSYQVQVQHELCVTGAERAYLAILIGGQKLVIHEIEPDAKFHKFLIEKEAEFWERILQKNPPPVDGSESARRSLNQMFNGLAQPPEYLDSQRAILCMEKDQQLQAIKAQLQDLQAKKSLLENQLLAMMQPYDAVELPNGVKLSNKQQTRKSYVVEESVYRVFRRSEK